jgi:hypothetical protein
MQSRVLALDSAARPTRWLTPLQAAHQYARGQVAHEIGDAHFSLYGGTNAQTGERSTLAANSIIMVRGAAHGFRAIATVPRVTRRLVFGRDRHLCAYCGRIASEADLSIDHIEPISRGGENTWMNVVTACRPCNGRKAARTPSEAGMRLLYTPYVPNHAEALILANRTILADQMALLLKSVPRVSRLAA